MRLFNDSENSWQHRLGAEALVDHPAKEENTCDHETPFRQLLIQWGEYPESGRIRFDAPAEGAD